MKRLSGLDATFLYMEGPTTFMHVASLIVVDPSTAPGEFTFESLRDLYRQRLDLAPPFRRRLVEVPFGINHPVWVEDPDFDLDFHLRHIAVPRPGTIHELQELVAHLVAMPLDRRHPLWEAWLIDGLDDGNMGILTKVHHSAIDGASGEELMVAILDLTPEIEAKPAPEAPWQPERVPTDVEMLGHGLWSLGQTPVRAAKTAHRTINAGLNIRSNNRKEPNIPPPPSLFSAPHTSFNAALTPHRSVATATVSLPEVKMVKNAFGTTVNDVVLALCAGALRHYLDERGEVLDGSLVAMVPISVRGEAGKGQMGNQVSSALTTLATDVADPVERLEVIHQGMLRTKEQEVAIGADTLQDWVEFAAPAVAGTAARLYSRTKMADRHRPVFNVTVSNVPGPPFPLYLAGARVVSTFPLGPIFDGGGINITVMSYLDHMDFGILACPELLPDVDTVADGLHRSLDELRKAADERTQTG